MRISEMPDNLMDRAWAGTLPVRLVRTYPKLFLLLLFLTAVIASMGALLMFAFTRNPDHLMLALPITTWLMTLGLPVIYSFCVRDVRIITPRSDGPDEIDLNQWWKKDFGGLDEQKARYEKGRRVFWLARPTPHEHEGEPAEDCAGCDPELLYFTPEQAEIMVPNEASELVDSSEVFGLAGWVASGSNYVFTKARSSREIIQMGMIAIIIIAELIAVFMLTGKLSEDPNAITGDTTPAGMGTVQTRN